MDDSSRVAELRSLVSSHLTPYYDTHFNLLRWIQGNPGLSMEKIAARLRHHLLFRSCCNSAWELDTILKKERCLPLHRYLPITKCGMSGVIPNCIVHVEQSGHIDFEGMIDNFSVTEIIKAGLYNLEEMQADVMMIEEETGKQASIMYVMDAEGIQYSRKLFDLVMKSMRSVSEFMVDHYVELVSSIVIVNVPSWANFMWRMVNPLLPERTRMKIIRLLSSSNWREEIQSLMDPAVGPTFWNDENHNEFKIAMERPQQVPCVELKNLSEKLEKLVVKAGQEYWMEYELEAGDTLTFRFTGTNNFAFTIVHEDNSDKSDVYSMRQIYPLFPLKVPIEDEIFITETGVYKVWFSNSKSWWSSLTIHHCFKVIKEQSI